MEWVRRFAPLGVIVALLAGLYLSGASRYVSLESLRTHEAALRGLVDHHFWEALGLFFLVYFTVTAACLPFNLIVTLAGGLMFGPWIGGAATLLAATAGSVVAYYAAQTALGAPLLRMARRRGGALQKIVDGFGRHAFSYVLSLRLVPVFPFWLVSLAAGVASPPLTAYVLGTLVGAVPGCFIYSGLGAGLGKAFAHGEQVDLGVIFSPHIMLPLAGLALLSLGPAILARRRKAAD